MKALVTGAAGFIGSHLTAALLDRGARGRRARLLHRLLPAGDQGSEPRGQCAAGRGFVSSRRSIQDADLPALLDGVTHVFHLAAQAGVRKSWGRDFRIYTDNNVDATQRLLEACVGRPLRALRLRLELVGLRRQRGDPDARGRAAAAGVAVRRDEARGRAALLPVSRRTTACRRRRCATSRSTARGSGPTWRSTGSSARRSTGEPITLYGDGEQTRDFTFVADAVAATDRRRRARRARARLQHRRRLARVGQPRARDHRPDRRPAARRSGAKPAQKGDMRDTFADTSLARADLGLCARACRSKKGLEAEYRWLVDHTGARVTHGSHRLIGVTLRLISARLALVAAWRAGRVRERVRRSRPPARRSPTSSSSSAAREALNEKHWLTAREYFRQLVDSYPQSPYRADAKLGLGDTYLGEGTRRVVRPGDQRVPGVPDVLPDARARRLRAVQAGDDALLPDARAGARSDRDARSDQGVDDSSSSAIRTAR